MLKPQDLYLCLKEKSTDFRTKLIEAGFPASVFENKDTKKLEFCIIRQEDYDFEMESYGDADIIFIGTDTAAVRRIIDNTWKSVLAFKDDTACLYFLYSIVSEYVFGMVKEFDLAEFYDMFISTFNHIKIIDCKNVDILNEFLTKTAVFSVNTVTEDVSYDKLSLWEKQITDIFPVSHVSFIMPQDIISFNKVFFVTISSIRN